MTTPRNCKPPRTRKDKTCFWMAAVQAWEKSGLAQSEFCRNQGLRSSTFRYWKKKLSAIEPDQDQPQELVPIQVAFESPVSHHSASTCSISMTVRGRYQVDVADDFRSTTLERVIRVLEGIS